MVSICKNHNSNMLFGMMEMYINREKDVNKKLILFIY